MKRPGRNRQAAERELERLEAELDKKNRIIAEVVEENLEPKGALKLGSKRQFTAAEKREALRLVERTRRGRAGRPVGS